MREAAVTALRSVLVLVEQRETRYRVQWYYCLFEQTMRGLSRCASAHLPPACRLQHALCHPSGANDCAGSRCSLLGLGVV